jgi:hypothetical protein
MMPDDATLKSQKMIRLSDFPESIQHDIQVIIHYIALQVVLEDDDDSSNEAKDRNSDR